jgi:hypothetical protein
MDSFNPNIRCPHCGKHNTPSVTGFGRTNLNVRTHFCDSCKQEYKVIVLVEVCADDTPTDMELSELQGRIQWMKQRIKERKNGLVSQVSGYASELARVEAETCGRQN